MPTGFCSLAIFSTMAPAMIFQRIMIPRLSSLLNPLKQEILCVRGNCDTEVDQMVLDFPIMAEYCLLELNGQTVFATHGHHFNPQNPPMLKDGDILLNGHTHIPANQNMGTYTYMNPGSVSIPKEGSAHGYMIFDGAFTWKDLDGNVLDISSNTSAAR